MFLISSYTWMAEGVRLDFRQGAVRVEEHVGKPVVGPVHEQGTECRPAIRFKVPQDFFKQHLGTLGDLADFLLFFKLVSHHDAHHNHHDLHQRKQHHREVIARVLRLGQLSKQVLHGFKSS